MGLFGILGPYSEKLIIKIGVRFGPYFINFYTLTLKTCVRGGYVRRTTSPNGGLKRYLYIQLISQDRCEANIQVRLEERAIIRRVIGMQDEDRCLWLTIKLIACKKIDNQV